MQQCRNVILIISMQLTFKKFYNNEGNINDAAEICTILIWRIQKIDQ